MLHLFIVLADGITIKIGDNIWTFGFDFILYLVIAAVVGLLAEYLVKYRLPFGFIGAIIAALFGIWLMTKIVVIDGIGDLYLFGVPVFRALIGAIILVGLWCLITFALTRRRYYSTA